MSINEIYIYVNIYVYNLPSFNDDDDDDDDDIIFVRFEGVPQLS